MNKMTKLKKSSIAVLLIAIILAISLTVFGQLSGKEKTNGVNESVVNIYDTQFGQTYKTELQNMNGVEFYLRRGNGNETTVLKIKTNDEIDENIILSHMVYTHLTQIIPDIKPERIQIIVYDEEGVFFDTTDVRLEFTQAFCREDYIQAVEKKEKLLYNFQS